MNEFTKGEWKAIWGSVKCNNKTVAEAHNPNSSNATFYTYQGEYVDSSYDIGDRLAKANAHLIATAGTAATKLAEAGYDAVKVLELLPQIMQHIEQCATDSAHGLFIQCRGDA